MPTTTDALAHNGIEGIASGMVVGLGTGRAAARAIDALASRVREEQLNITCVATSERSALQASGFGLRVLAMDQTTNIDWLFDGADEVDPQLRMIKGAGGAMTREKIVARAASHRVYLIQESKVVSRLGEHHSLPIEVLHFGLASITTQIEGFGLSCQLRQVKDGAAILTDNGHVILDAALPDDVDVATLSATLDSTPGVVGHGLFLDEADVVFIENEQGNVRRLDRLT